MKFHAHNAKVTVAMATDSLVLGAENIFSDFMLACLSSYLGVILDCSRSISFENISITKVSTFLRHSVLPILLIFPLVKESFHSFHLLCVLLCVLS